MEDFKSRAAHVDEKGRRKWIYAFQPEGKYYRWRTVISVFYLALFFISPFIKIYGAPFLQFNIPNGTFYLFGQLFLPHDFILLGIIMIVALVSVILFTLVFGRVFCGWICPQTIFMEMVFRRIEYWIEGPAHLQRKRDNLKGEGWLPRKLFKHFVFLLLSFLIANTFLAYIIGVDALWKIVTEPISSHWIGLVSIIGFTLIFYCVYAYVRELVCTVVCPYGRLQGVLMDKDTLVVAYDYNRGEPRSKKRNDEKVGDCIDCGMCVNVCPTGIDIRNGVQLECINCTACIDACNKMMEATHKPLNLITFKSENQLKQSKSFQLNYRSKIFIAALIILSVVMSSMIFNRTSLDATIMRVGGQLYQENVAENKISNLYKIKIINKSASTLPYFLKVKEQGANIKYVGSPLDSLEAGIHYEETFFIEVPNSEIKQRKNQLHIQIYSGDRLIDEKEVSFLGKY